MDVSVTSKLKDLWAVQSLDTEINEINILLGDLPVEVADLEDEIAGLQTRFDNINSDIEQYNAELAAKKNSIADFRKLIDKYDSQLGDIKNNREYEALEKEKEIAGLEILSAEKAMRDISAQLEIKQGLIDATKERMEIKGKDLEFKKNELLEIQKESADERVKLEVSRDAALAKMDKRLGTAYTRIRDNMVNNVDVAPIVRGSCGGCFANIPPQRKSDIRAHFRIIDCESCGRVLIDKSVTGLDEEEAIEPVKKTRRKLKLTSK